MKCLYSFVLLLFTSTLYAQTSTEVPMGQGAGLYLDVHAGFNRATLSGSGVDRMDDITSGHGDEMRIESHTGFEGGINIRQTLGGFFHVKSGINFSQRGTTLWNTGYVKLPRYQSLYLGLPLLFGFTTNGYKTNIKFAFTLDAGIAVYANISSSTDWIVDTHAVTDFLFQPGMSYQITPLLNLGVQYRYAKDLTTAYTFYYVPEHKYEDKYTTQALLVSLRFKPRKL